MNHLTRIYTTAGQLQASRSFLKDLRGLGKTPEGVEFAKALAEGTALGASPMEVVEEVVKAMGGNQTIALEILGAVEEITKAMVGQHTRTLANGKTVNVKAYESARTAAMKQTTLAHGATFHAMRTKTAEGHDNAASAHEEAAKQHGEAHAVHPMDVPEVGEEHAKLKASHLNAVTYHRSEADAIRGEDKYNRAKVKAGTATRAAGEAYDSHSKVAAHQAAAAAHLKAAEAKPGAGHEEQAEGHDIQAKAHEASFKAGMGPLPYPTVKRGAMASGEAEKATTQAVKTGTKSDHGKAAALHAQAIDHHMALHGAHEDSEDGHHGGMAMRHMELHAYHAKKAQEAEGAKVETQTVAKAHHEASQRVVNGKVIQIAAYDDGVAAKQKAAKKAHPLADLDHPAYNTPTKVAKRNGNPRTAIQYNDTEASAQAIRANSNWSKSDHAKLAEAHTAAADYHKKVWAKTQDEAHEQTFGKKAGPFDYKVSGIGREEYSEPHKDQLRYHAHAETKHGTLAAAHAHIAKHVRNLPEQSTIAKSEGGCMTTLGGGTDIATKTGGAALAVEGRPDEKDRKKDEDEEEVGKSHVEGHTRTVNGKVVQVKAYDFERMWNHHGEVMNHASHNPRAASKTDDAVLASEEAHGNEELGVEKNDQHAYAAHMHREAAQEHDHAAAASSDDALRLHHATAAMNHHSFADEHTRIQRSMEKPDAGEHSTDAMNKMLGMSLHGNGTARQATEHAHNQTIRAGEKDTALSHGRAYNAHRAAAEAHRDRARDHTNRMDIMPEVIENHHAIAKHHDDAAAAHLEEMRAKKDAATPGVEGARIVKAHVEQHTRVVGGKTVQVSGYDTHANAANAISQNATKATSHSISKGHEEHAAAAQLHKDAAEAHRNAAQHAPEAWMARGHEDQANLHGHYASSHAKKAAELAPAARAKKTPVVTELPNGMRHTEGEDSTGKPIHSVSAGGAILGHGKTREEAMAMADRETKAHQEGKTTAATPQSQSDSAKAAGREAAMKGRGESGYEESHGKAAMLHEKAGLAHLQAHAEGKGGEHANEAGHHFAQSVDHTGESHGAAGKYEHAAKIAGLISEHADAHKLEDNYKSHDQHAAGHLMAIEAHGQAREAAQANASRSLTNGDEEKAASYQSKADAHHAKVNHHRAEMAKGHDEINLRAKRAESASRATMAPAGGAKVHEEAAAAHRHAAAIQYDSEVRGQHEAKAAHHDEQVAAMKRRTPEDAAETLHGKALAAAKSVKGRTGKQNLPYSETAHAASVRAEQTGSKDDHAQAARLHTGAEMSHDQAREDTGYKHKGHDEAWMAHHRAAAYHRAKAQ